MNSNNDINSKNLIEAFKSMEINSHYIEDSIKSFKIKNSFINKKFDFDKLDQEEKNFSIYALKEYLYYCHTDLDLIININKTIKYFEIKNDR